jgi:glycosyltransferase involved in cell wall biosynthesis
VTAGALAIVVATHTRLGAPWVVSSHQLARAWAHSGHRVLLVAAPVTLWHAGRIADPETRKRFRRAAEGVRALEPGLVGIVPVGLLPWMWAARLALRDASMPGFALGLAGQARRAGFAAPDLVVADHPQFVGLDRTLGARRFVYRATDLHEEVHGQPIVADLERVLLRRADVVIATSAPVAERMLAQGAPAAPIVENGVALAHFTRPVPPPPEYASLRRPIAVYVGALDFRFDAALLLRLAAARRDVAFVLIGTGDTRGAIRAAGASNVHLLGVRPYAAVPAYLQHATLALLPSNGHPANAGRSPMKLYEYAAAGLPVLATRTPELARRAESFVRFFDAVRPESSLDAILSDPPRPDPPALRERDWPRLAERVLALAMT